MKSAHRFGLFPPVKEGGGCSFKNKGLGRTVAGLTMHEAYAPHNPRRKEEQCYELVTFRGG